MAHRTAQKNWSPRSTPAPPCWLSNSPVSWLAEKIAHLGITGFPGRLLREKKCLKTPCKKPTNHHPMFVHLIQEAKYLNPSGQQCIIMFLFSLYLFPNSFGWGGPIWCCVFDLAVPCRSQKRNLLGAQLKTGKYSRKSQRKKEICVYINQYVYIYIYIFVYTYVYLHSLTSIYICDYMCILYLNIRLSIL